MKNMTKSEKAQQLFKQGYNCSQAVIGAFADEIGMDFETAVKIASSFGGGMGRLREVCGAVSGMFMVLGLKYGYSSPNDHTIKTEHYARIQETAKQFVDKNGSLICRDLLKNQTVDSSHIPSERNENYYKARKTCLDVVGDAAKIVENYINQINNQIIE